MNLIDAYRQTIKEAIDCEQDGSAHEQWLKAREIDIADAQILMAAVAGGQLPLEQFLRICYESGYTEGYNFGKSISESFQA